MTRSTRGIGKTNTRARAALLSGAALGMALLISGCGAGQISQTADTKPAVPGANSTPAPGQDNSIQLRNVLLAYPGMEGYRQGATAPLQLLIFNTGERPVTLVEVTTDAAGRVTLHRGAGPSATPSGPVSQTPSASPSGSGSPGGQPVQVTVPVDGYVAPSPATGTWLQLEDLTKDIGPGESVTITFVFDNGAKFTLDVPVGLPTAPAPRGSAAFEESGNE